MSDETLCVYCVYIYNVHYTFITFKYATIEAQQSEMKFKCCEAAPLVVVEWKLGESEAVSFAFISHFFSFLQKFLWQNLVCAHATCKQMNVTVTPATTATRQICVSLF